MFMGEYNHTIDAKGRLIIPAKFREPLGEEFVLTRGLDGCLYIYPMDEWNAFEEKLRALPLTNKNARTFTRFFVAGATNCELDKQGRILVPQTLREFAGLEKDVVLTGNLNRIEVWSKEKWSENCDYDDLSFISLRQNNQYINIKIDETIYVIDADRGKYVDSFQDELSYIQDMYYKDGKLYLARKVSKHQGKGNRCENLCI